MNVQEKMTMFLCVANRKRNHGETAEAEQMEHFIGQGLLKEITEEELDQAYRLADYEALFQEEAPFQLSETAKKEIEDWLTSLRDSTALADEVKEQVPPLLQLIQKEIVERPEGVGKQNNY